MHVADMSAFGAMIATCQCKLVWGCSPEHHDARRAVSGREVPRLSKPALERAGWHPTALVSSCVLETRV
jgi:hypothetical protein